MPCQDSYDQDFALIYEDFGFDFDWIFVGLP